MVIPWHSELLLVLYMAEPPKTKSGIRLPYYYLLYPDETILLRDILFDPILHRVRPQCGQLKPRMLKIQRFWAYILDFFI